jgi:hypothetical protein
MIVWSAPSGGAYCIESNRLKTELQTKALVL